MTEKKHLQNKPQVRIQSPQLLLEGDTMRELLRWMRVKEGRWYTNFRHKGKHVGISLKAYQPDLRTALDNFAILREDLKQGKVPNGIRKKIKFLNPEKPFDKEHQSLWDKHIIPFFGEYTPNDLTPELIEKYMESKWGRDDSGNLQAMATAWKRHRRVLRQLVHSVDPNYDFNKRLLADIKFVSLFKDMLPPLTRAQIDLAWEQAQKTYSKGGKGDNFKRAFWIMVWTGIEAMDIADLRPKHFKKIKDQEWLVKERHKTMLTQNRPVIKIPVLPVFRKILDEVPTPLDKNAPYFPSLDTEACNKTIARYFTKAGLKGYGAKYLRRHLAEMALDLGQSETLGYSKH